jgi:hypothetical protein
MQSRSQNLAVSSRMYSRLRRLLSQLKPKMPQEEMKQMVHQKFEHAVIVENLAKGAAVASVFDNGDLRFDFGASVPDRVKKAAIEWAKKRGFSPTEASLAKNVDAPSYVKLSSGSTAPAVKCVKRFSWHNIAK